MIHQITELREENHCTTLFLWKLTFMLKFLRVVLIYMVSLCRVFTLVLLAAVPVLSAIVLKHKLRKSGVCEACTRRRRHRGEEPGSAGKSTDAWLHPWTVCSSPQGWCEPFWATFPKGDTKKGFQEFNLWSLTTCCLQVFLLLEKKFLLTALFAKENKEGWSFL